MITPLPLKTTTSKRVVVIAALGLASLFVLYTIFDYDASVGTSLRDPQDFRDITARALAEKNNPSPLLLLPEIPNKKTDEPTAWDIRLNERYYHELDGNGSTSTSRHLEQGHDQDEFTTICLCPKCGSSSFYTKLYEVTHHTSVTYGYDKTKWLWRLQSPEWKNIDTRGKTNWSRFSPEKSLVLIRDPKKRLLSSWKSKVQCNADAVDTFDARRILPELLDLAGFSHEIFSYYTDNKGLKTPCLDLSTFLLVMFQIHLQGKEGLVNDHMRPQHLICFLHVGPEEWGVVTTIDDDGLTCKLEKMLGVESAIKNGGIGNSSSGGDGDVFDCHDVEKMGKEHTTGKLSEYTTMTEVDEAILNAITRAEYEILGPYLD
mmetsp:Transcript_7019/g.13462  ORF Transcript_7019/g.13462 Transcript_7019/m.13462 type:complete len:374 (+) Transcript_7019:71-1192(+)